MVSIQISVLILALFFFCLNCFLDSDEEERFVKSVRKNLTKHSPPSNLINRSVFLLADIYQILGVDEKEGTINVKLWTYLSYRVSNINWDPNMTGFLGFSLMKGVFC